jgi:hypothetical protein
MYHKGTGYECVNWIHVTHYNVEHNKLRLVAQNKGGFWKAKIQLLKVYSVVHRYLSYSCWVHKE